MRSTRFEARSLGGFIGFGGLEVTKPYEFIGFGAAPFYGHPDVGVIAR